MNAKRKIGKVLKQIKEESEINPDSRWVRFIFNTRLVGAGILSDDEEKRILLKLQKEKIIKLHLPDCDDGFEPFAPEELIKHYNIVLVEILDGFDKKYQIYKLFYSDFDFWEITNLLWWLWKLLLFVSVGIIKCATIVKDNKIISLVFFILAMLASDYAMAWQNLRYIIDSVNIFNL
ncbi:MAG: hypothetical protein WCQ96_01360 [Patescibacteria group bacterium]